MPPGGLRAWFTKQELCSRDFALPNVSLAPPLIKEGLFTWEVEPYAEKKERVIRLTCSKCPKYYLTYWPIRSVSARRHYEGYHPDLLLSDTEQTLANKPPGPISQHVTNEVDSTEVLTQSLSNSSPGDARADPTSTDMGRKRPRSALSDESTLKRQIAEFFVATNQPIGLCDCLSFQRLITPANSDSLVSISSSEIQSQLEVMYSNENHLLKLRLARNKSRYSLSINEWASVEQHAFAMATLQFINADFALEKYTIGVEAFRNRDIPYAGNVLSERLPEVLQQLEIDDRIMSITRYSTGPPNTATESFENHLCGGLEGLPWQRSERNVTQVLKLATEYILDYTFFTQNTSDPFEQSLENISREFPQFEHFSQKVKRLPCVIQSIFNALQQSDYLGGAFDAMVSQRSENRQFFKCFVNPLTHCMFPCLSLHRRLSKFVYYRSEIMALLERAKRLPENERDSLHLISFDISDDEWDYLITVRDTLEIFRGPIIELQQNDTPKVNCIVFCIQVILKKLFERWKLGSLKNYPHADFGLQKAYKEIFFSYYLLDNENNPMKSVYLATVLDPRFKLGLFVDLGVSPKAVAEIRTHFCMVYESYKREHEKQHFECAQPHPEWDETTGTRLPNRFPGYDEAETYLAEEREEITRSISDYYKTRGNAFPVICCMARDLLATPTISAPEGSSLALCEIPTRKRNKKSRRVFEMKAILRSRGVVREEMKISKHCDSIIE